MAEDKLRRSRSAAALAGALTGALDGSLIIIAISDTDHLAWVVLALVATLPVLAVLVLFLFSRNLILSANQNLGIETRGLWWCEHGQFGFFPWDSVRAVQFGSQLSYPGIKFGSTLDIFTHQPVPPGNPVIDRLARDGHYRIELTRPPLAFFIATAVSRYPPFIAAAIKNSRPDKWIAST